MKHKQFEEWLQLSFFDELNEEQVSELNRHLSVCEQCRNEQLELKKLLGTMPQRTSVASQEMLLQDARRSLRLRMYSDLTQQSLWDRIKAALDKLIAPQLQVTLGSAAMFAVGILGGYFIFHSPTVQSSAFLQSSTTSSMMEAGESQVTNVQFLDRNTQTGEVNFTFITVTPAHIRGNINDDHVQKVLARALVSDQNIGTRLRAINMIGTQFDQTMQRSIPLVADVKSALISALLHDRNLGVRREAFSALRNHLPDTTIIRAFLSVMANEKNTGLKIAAINSLDVSKFENQSLNREILEMLKQKAQSDDNNYIRIKAKIALQEVQ